MPKYTVEDSQTGKRITFEWAAPTPPTDADMEEVFAAARGTEPKENGMIGKIWSGLAEPERLSREGLTRLAGMVPDPAPTGNLPGDILRGGGRIVADTLAEAAPGFVSREALLASGVPYLGKAIAPSMGAIGGKIAQGAEGISGLEYKTPGILKEAAKDASLFFGKGTKAAKSLYQKAEGGVSRGPFEGMYKPEEIIDKTLAIFKEGSERFLTPTQAHMARKAVSKAMETGRNVKDELISLRGKLDKIAKLDPNIAKGDVAFARGRKTEALRTLFPTNKGGKTSIAKMFLGGVAGGVGAYSGGDVGDRAQRGLLPLAIMSPASQGLAATGLGFGARMVGGISPNAGIALGAILGRRRKK